MRLPVGSTLAVHPLGAGRPYILSRDGTRTHLPKLNSTGGVVSSLKVFGTQKKTGKIKQIIREITALSL